MHWIQFVWMEVPSVVLTLEVLAVELVEWMWCEELLKMLNMGLIL